jgi:hypothetical protein
MKILFGNKVRSFIEISKNNMKNEIISFFKENCLIKKNFAVRLDDAKFIPEFCRILQENFTNTAFKILICDKVLEDISEDQRKMNITKTIHESFTNHRGIQETENEIKQSFYWPNIRGTVSNIINNCEICQTMKYDRNPPKQKFELTPTPGKPFEVIHVDTFTICKQKFLTLIDSFSKYAQAYPIIAPTAIHTTNAILNFINHHGVPKVIVTDNGTEFKNNIVKEFASLHGIILHYITPLNPNSNGAIERFHSTLIEHLRILKKTKKETSILHLMPYAILGYNNSIHSVTKQRPINIINGHLDSKSPFDTNNAEELYTEYVNQHKDITAKMYEKISNQLSKQKSTNLATIHVLTHQRKTYITEQDPGTKLVHHSSQ